jgi:hypothetical protein
MWPFVVIWHTISVLVCFFGSATPCASPPPWPSIFSNYFWGAHHLVSQDDRHLLGHAMASDISVAGRATRLGEFSPIGSLFTLCNCLEITEVAYILVNLVPQLRLCINFDKNGLGHTGRMAGPFRFGMFGLRRIWQPCLRPSKWQKSWLFFSSRLSQTLRSQQSFFFGQVETGNKPKSAIFKWPVCLLHLTNWVKLFTQLSEKFSMAV